MPAVEDCPHLTMAACCSLMSASSSATAFGKLMVLYSASNLSTMPGVETLALYAAERGCVRGREHEVWQGERECMGRGGGGSNGQTDGQTARPPDRQTAGSGRRALGVGRRAPDASRGERHKAQGVKLPTLSAHGITVDCRARGQHLTLEPAKPRGHRAVHVPKSIGVGADEYVLARAWISPYVARRRLTSALAESDDSLVARFDLRARVGRGG